MKFFSQQELEEVYGKDFDEISPTSQPEDEYMTGQGQTVCKECGADLPVKCNPSGDGFTEIAYCDMCNIEYKRVRELISTNPKYQIPHMRTDEREEYLCPQCKVSHPFTTAQTEFSYEESPVIHSYEQITLTCPCGEVLTIQNTNLPIKLDCSACPREFTFNME